MRTLTIDVTDLGGKAHPGDKVVLWRPRVSGSATHAGRVISTAPHTVLLEDGKATVPDVEPGEMTVLLQCRGVESQGPVTVGVPDGDHTVTLRALLESQFEYAPPIVSAVQEAASNASASEEAAIQAQIRSEAAADRAETRVDEAINNGAALVRDEVKQDADRAVSARQAATQSESNAAASEDAAASSASNAATSETNAKQSETNAGDYAAVATTAATEAVDAMERATDLVGGDFATREYVDALRPELDAKADASTVNDLAAVTTGFAGVARRNSRRIRELVSELGDKADKTSVTSALARKADQADVADLSALATSALGVGKRNATQVRQLAAALAGKADQSALTSGLSTKADKVDLSALTANTLDALEAQDADIQTAITTADTASTTAQNVEARVAAVEAVADLAPESPVDGQTASLISQPDSLTKAAVTAAVGAAFQETPPGSGLYTLTI